MYHLYNRAGELVGVTCEFGRAWEFESNALGWWEYVAPRFAPVAPTQPMR